MHKRLSAVMLCLVLAVGCFVSTSVKVHNRQLPTEFSSEALVITLEEDTGLGLEDLAFLEEDVLKALAERGINSIPLSEAVGVDDPDSINELLLKNDYNALLKIVVKAWGSRTETLQDPVPTSVDSSDTGPDPGSTFRPPYAINSNESVPGPESSYKEVSMVWYLTDLDTGRLIWSGLARAKPAVVGRSFLYHRFNRNLEYEELAERCIRKLAAKLASVWPKESEKKK